MEKSRVEQELDFIFSESPAQAADRVANHLTFDLHNGGPLLALYGAGTLGRTVLAKLRQVEVEPVVFADDTPEKQGQVIDGLSVMAPQQAVAEYGRDIIFVVTILNPLLRFLDAQERLQRLTGAHVISFLDLGWKYPDVFLPYYQFELPQNLLTKAPAIRRAFNLFEDEESRRQFVAHLKFRLYLNYEALPANSRDDYFPRHLLPTLPANAVFVDCGAYDGDTLRRFLEHQRGHFSRIYAFEPDEKNYQKLQAYVATLKEGVSRRIHLFNAGVGDQRAKLSFNQTGNMSASFSHTGATQVEVVPIQEVVETNGGPIYLKFDVEGAEWEALRGAEALIKRTRPLLAISVYHRPDDLWEIPLYLDSLNLDYHLFLRTQGEDGMDVICYAIPPQYTT